MSLVPPFRAGLRDALTGLVFEASVFAIPRNPLALSASRVVRGFGFGCPYVRLPFVGRASLIAADVPAFPVNDGHAVEFYYSGGICHAAIPIFRIAHCTNESRRS